MDELYKHYNIKSHCQLLHTQITTTINQAPKKQNPSPNIFNNAEERKKHLNHVKQCLPYMEREIEDILGEMYSTIKAMLDAQTNMETTGYRQMTKTTMDEEISFAPLHTISEESKTIHSALTAYSQALLNVAKMLANSCKFREIHAELFLGYQALLYKDQIEKDAPKKIGLLKRIYQKFFSKKWTFEMFSSVSMWKFAID